MSKTNSILQHLARADGDEHITAIAAAIGEADAPIVQISALCTYLRTKGRAETGAERGTWRITAAGRKWIRELAEESDEDRGTAPPSPVKPARAKRMPKADDAIAAKRISAPLKRAPANSNGRDMLHQLPAIESGIPFEGSVERGAYCELARRMNPGDSVLFENEIRGGMLRRAMKISGMRAVGRKVAGGYRVWRMK